MALLLILSGASSSTASEDATAAPAKPVSVYPAPGTPVASDTTSFSFRGLKPSQLGPVRIIGSRSGPHGGRRLAHSDGNGVSILPKRRFVRGEIVRVFTGKRIKLTRGGDFRVRIGRFQGKGRMMPIPQAKNTFPRLHSKPGLRPPRIDVLTSRPGASTGGIFFAPKQTGLTIADNLGRITWFRPTVFRQGTGVQNFNMQTYRGQPVLTFWKAVRQGPRFHKGHFHILDRRYTRIAKFTMGNGYRPDSHELVITPRNTALALSYRGVGWDLRKFGGPRDGRVFDNVVQEIDIKTGAVLFEWHSVGNVGLGASVSRPEPGEIWDYFHVNSVNDDGDSFLISARKVNSIYRIDRKLAKVKWRLRGDGNDRLGDFDMGPGTGFGYQHDAQRLPDGDISLFDNGVARAFPNVREESSALVLRLRGPKGKRRATLVKRTPHPDMVISRSQGSAQVMPGGNTFIGWGSTFRLTEFAPDGKVVFDATFDEAPVNSYRARKAVWPGIPNGRPAIASRGTGKGATVWASWNGAGDIDRWRVLTGPTGKRLETVITRPWENLETEIPVEKLGHKVRVQALDANGNVLGQSPVTGIGKRSR